MDKLIELWVKITFIVKHDVNVFKEKQLAQDLLLSFLNLRLIGSRCCLSFTGKTIQEAIFFKACIALGAIKDLRLKSCRGPFHSRWHTLDRKIVPFFQIIDDIVTYK